MKGGKKGVSDKYSIEMFLFIVLKLFIFESFHLETLRASTFISLVFIQLHSIYRNM